MWKESGRLEVLQSLGIFPELFQGDVYKHLKYFEHSLSDHFLAGT